MPASVDSFTAPELIALVRSERVARDAADVRILELALAWADRHTIDPAGPFVSTVSHLEDDPVVPFDDPDAIEWLGLPSLRWDTAASFAAALGLSTAGGKALIRDALVLAHRLPQVWQRLRAGGVAVWRARRIAQAVLGQPDDVTAYLDADLAPRAGTIGPVLLDRALDEAMLRLHPEERELRQLADLDSRYARLEEHTINHTGIAHFAVRGDWADVSAFDDAVADIAAALDRSGCEESLDVRRSMAVGVLADPEAALALLAHEPAPKPKPKRRIIVNLNLDPTHLAGLDPVILDVEGRAMLDQIVREWCGRPDARVSVRPVRHCGGCPDCTASHEQRHAATQMTYRPSARDLESVVLRDRHCAFPFCTRPAARCDCDHVDPFDHADPTRGGPTCACNLAALCRHHHRLKTHSAWTYTIIEPAVYLWADRYGQQFLRSRDGTRDVTGDTARRAYSPA